MNAGSFFQSTYNNPLKQAPMQKTFGKPKHIGYSLKLYF